ncbi:hypothetical protein QT711_17805 [Sporosarcina saromensis]|uniref:RDD family protein n=1 Tax=Sporosarcina saromensis TaxID=359365 RepID=A0ABU4GDG8_9BACL|nr:hypothetical protein [Sporosarcina saromensis]MDW0115019.1 hypothetical protein [Sporosarcina saromensis]
MVPPWQQKKVIGKNSEDGARWEIVSETQWNIQEVKRLKKKQLILADIVILLIFFLSIYYVSVGWPIFVFSTLSIVLVWIVVAYSLYTLITGKVIGTKTSRILLSFEKDRLGKKRWKRKKMIEVVFLTIVSASCTVLVFAMEPSIELVSFINLWPCIGAWLGYNVGEIFRITNLQ